MEPCLFIFFLEFLLLAQSSHSVVVTDWTNLKPSPIHTAWLKTFWMRVDVMLYGWKKAREKSTWYRLLETLVDSSVPNVFLKSLFAGFSSSFWPITLSQFEELLLDDPEVDAIAAPAGLLVDTDLRM